MADERPTCLMCGERFNSVGRHVLAVHGITAVEYRDQFGIRRSASLSSPASRARQTANLRARIASGKLDAHLAGNRARAAAANALGVATKRALQAAGTLGPGGKTPIPREVAEAIVAAVEAGSRVATAVKHSAISTTGFHSMLARHPDLRARLDSAKKKRLTGRRRRSPRAADAHPCTIVRVRQEPSTTPEGVVKATGQGRSEASSTPPTPRSEVRYEHIRERTGRVREH